MLDRERVLRGEKGGVREREKDLAILSSTHIYIYLIILFIGHVAIRCVTWWMQCLYVSVYVCVCVCVWLSIKDKLKNWPFCFQMYSVATMALYLRTVRRPVERRTQWRSASVLLSELLTSLVLVAWFIFKQVLFSYDLQLWSWKENLLWMWLMQKKYM